MRNITNRAEVSVPRPNAVPIEAIVGSEDIFPIKNPATVIILPEVKTVGKD